MIILVVFSLVVLYEICYTYFRSEVFMKFNVHYWTCNDWRYIATVVAPNEQDAAKTVAKRFSLNGRFASYPHIDCYDGQMTSDTALTEIK